MQNYHEVSIIIVNIFSLVEKIAALTVKLLYSILTVRKDMLRRVSKTPEIFNSVPDEYVNSDMYTNFADYLNDAFPGETNVYVRRVQRGGGVLFPFASPIFD